MVQVAFDNGVNSYSPPPVNAAPPPSSDAFQQALDNQLTQGGSQTPPPTTIYSQPTQTAISTAQATDTTIHTMVADDDLRGLHHLVSLSEQEWKVAEQDMVNDLTAGFAAKYEQMGAGKLAPDLAVQSAYQVSQNHNIDNGSNFDMASANALKEASQAGYQAALTTWHKEQITSSDLKTLKQNVINAEHSTGSQAQQYWSMVEAQLQQIQLSGVLFGNQPQGQLPQDTALNLKNELTAMYDGDTKFAAHNQAAYNSVTKQLELLNLTDQQLKPFVSAYQAYQAAMSNPKLDAIAKNKALENLRQAIEDQLAGAQKNLLADKNMNAQGRAYALNAVASTLLNFGPQTPEYAGAVIQANMDLRVTQPAQQVAQAYASGKNPEDAAQKAADKLKEVVEAAGDPSYAAMILQASEPTLLQIGTQLGKYLNDLRSLQAGQTTTRPTGQSEKLQKLYNALSQAFEQANSTSSTKADVMVTEEAASALLASIPQDHQGLSRFGVFGVLGHVAQQAIASGNGSTLTLALAQNVKDVKSQGGDPTDVDLLMQGYFGGVRGLHSKTTTDVQALAETVNTLNTLVSSWGQYMTPSQLNDAVTGYMKRNPEVASAYKTEMNAVINDGEAAGQLKAAFDNFGQGIGPTAVSDQAKNETNNFWNDSATQFSVQASGWVQQQVLQTASRLGRAFQPNQGITAAISIPTMISAAKGLKAITKTSLFQSLLKNNHQTWFTKFLLNVIGLPGLASNNFLIGLAGAGIAFYGGSIPFATTNEKKLYNGVGMAKEATELFARIYKARVPNFDRWFNAIDKPAAEALAWNLVGAAYSCWGFTLDLRSNLSWTDPFRGAANWASLVGDGFGTLSGLGFVAAQGAGLAKNLPWISDAFANGSVDISAGVYGLAGAASVIATVLSLGAIVIQAFHDHQVAVDNLTQASHDFLQDGLGSQIKPWLLKDLTPGVSGLDNTTSAIQAFAKAEGVTPADVIKFLNTQDQSKVEQFLASAKFLANSDELIGNSRGRVRPSLYQPVTVDGLRDAAYSLFRLMPWDIIPKSAHHAI